MRLRANVVEHSWSGHGEGGTTLSVEIDGFTLSNLYDNKNENDREICEQVARLVNQALEEFEG
jgi:hypothetical protein